MESVNTPASELARSGALTRVGSGFAQKFLLYRATTELYLQYRSKPVTS